MLPPSTSWRSARCSSSPRARLLFRLSTHQSFANGHIITKHGFKEIIIYHTVHRGYVITQIQRRPNWSHKEVLTTPLVCVTWRCSFCLLGDRVQLRPWLELVPAFLGFRGTVSQWNIMSNGSLIKCLQQRIMLSRFIDSWWGVDIKAKNTSTFVRISACTFDK